MGQEASVPVDGRQAADASLEEQAKAPPSSVNYATNNSNTAEAGASSSSSTQKDKRNKFGMFQRGGNHQHNHISGNKQHHETPEDFEQREAARAAAAGGHLYGRQESSNSDDDYRLHKMQMTPPSTSNSSNNEPIGSTFYQPAIRNDEIAKAEEARREPTLESTIAEMQIYQRAQHNVPLADGSSAPSGKKSMFPGRAKSMINSMRNNLSIGGALRKKNELQDWEKQWDEDDDDDSDDSGGEYETAATSRQQQAQIRPGMDAGHSSAGVAQHQQQQQSSSLQQQQPPPPPPTAQQQQQQHRAAMAKTPPPKQQQSGVPRYPAQPVTPPPHARDLLLSPVSPDQSAWDMAVSQQQQDGGRKPDVQMFLPMLRVLGKGSFGKVRAVHCYIL